MTCAYVKATCVVAQPRPNVTCSQVQVEEMGKPKTGINIYGLMSGLLDEAKKTLTTKTLGGMPTCDAGGEVLLTWEVDGIYAACKKCMAAAGLKREYRLPPLPEIPAQVNIRPCTDKVPTAALLQITLANGKKGEIPIVLDVDDFGALAQMYTVAANRVVSFVQGSTSEYLPLQNVGAGFSLDGLAFVVVFGH